MRRSGCPKRRDVRSGSGQGEGGAGADAGGFRTPTAPPAAKLLPLYSSAAASLTALPTRLRRRRTIMSCGATTQVGSGRGGCAGLLQARTACCRRPACPLGVAAAIPASALLVPVLLLQPAPLVCLLCPPAHPLRQPMLDCVPVLPAGKWLQTQVNDTKFELAYTKAASVRAGGGCTVGGRAARRGCLMFAGP